MFYMAIRNLKAEISDHCLIGIFETIYKITKMNAI